MFRFITLISLFNIVIGLSLAAFLDDPLPYIHSVSLLILGAFTLVCLFIAVYLQISHRGLIVLRIASLMLFSLLLFALSFGLNQMHILNRIEQQISADYEGENLLIEGIVVANTASEGPFRRFHFVASQCLKPLSICQALVDQKSSLEGKLLRLSWRSSNSLSAGEVWRLSVRLKRPRGFVNPNGFDYHAWLLSQGINATGYVRHSEFNTIVFEENTKTLLHWISINSQIARIRESVIHKIDSLCRHCDQAPYIKALLVGDRSGVSAENWEVLQSTGTIHLLAISGLHVGLIATLAYYLVAYGLRLLSLITSTRRIRFLPAIVSIMASVIYSGLANFSIPTQRAVIVVILVNIALIFARRCNPLWFLGVAAILVLGLDPFAATQSGFVLSFSAVIILLTIFRHRFNLGSPVFGFIKAQYAMFFGLFTPLIALGLPLSLIAPFANTFAIPLVSLLIMPLLFFTLFALVVNDSLAAVLLQVSDVLLSFLIKGLEFFNSVLPVLNFPRIDSLILIALFLSSGFILLLPRAFFVRVPAFILMCAVLIHAGRDSDAIRVQVLDVGQGLSVVFGASKETLVYDFGAKFSDDFDMGNRVVAPYLLSLGRKRIDTAIVSHGDNDHAGGFNSFKRVISVGQIFAGEVEKVEGSEPCNTESSIDSEFDISVLWPEHSRTSAKAVKANTNNRSCVLLITLRGVKILLTGDIDKSVERVLLENPRLSDGVDILFAPHHGSNTSSSLRFIQAMNPKHVIFSAGYRNRYRHPASKVRARYRAQGVSQWNTGLDGAIAIDIDASGQYVLSAERCKASKLWYDKDCN